MVVDLSKYKKKKEDEKKTEQEDVMERFLQVLHRNRLNSERVAKERKEWNEKVKKMYQLKKKEKKD